MDKEKQRLYDEVISTLITNVMAERKHNGHLILKEFNPSDPSHMLYYEATKIISDINHEKIYLNMKLWDYIKFVYHNIGRWQLLSWASDWKINEWELDKGNDFIIESADRILSFVKEFYLKEKDLDFSEFDSIYEQVYGGNNGDTSNSN